MMRTVGLTLVASVAAWLAPQEAQANTITESFTVSVPSVVHLTGDDFFLTSSFALFDPTLGTLDEIETSLKGSAIWGSNAQAPSLTAVLALDQGGNVTAPFKFNTPGTINFDLSGTDSAAPDPALATGTGTTALHFRLLGDPDDTFATSVDGLQGSITFDFTPVTEVPEPASLALFAGGLVAFGWQSRGMPARFRR
jgi:hypothetical protein